MSLFDAIGELGWFSWVLALVVGGPSTLSILQSVFVDHELVPALRWIVSSYNGVLSVLGAIVEPLVQPTIDWISARLGVEIHLYPHWRPLFGLGSVFAISLARTYWRDGERTKALQFGIALTIGALIGALAAGLAPLSGGWWTQGLMAFAPLTAMSVSIVAVNVMIDSRDVDWGLGGILLLFSCAAFGVAALVSLFQDAALFQVAAQGAGILTLGALLLALAISMLQRGLRDDDKSFSRFGLTVLSGFIAAALVLAADAALKMQAAAA